MSLHVNDPTLPTVPPKFKPAPAFPRSTAPVVRAAEDAARGGPDAVRAFWRDAARTGTPVVAPAGPGEHTATFLWRGGDEVADVLLVADRSADAGSFTRNRMERVPGSDIWHLTYRMGSDWRSSYAVAPVPADGAPPPGPLDPMTAVRRSRALAVAEPADAPAIARWFDALAHARPDPLARERLDDRWSVASLPDAPPEAWRGLPTAAPAGRVDPLPFTGADPATARTVRVYTPAAGLPPAGELPVVVLLDGDDWHALPLAPLLDRLIAARVLPPMVVAMVPSLDFAARVRELACHDPFVAALTGELLPALRAGFGVSADPDRVLVAGQSLGGLTALYTAHRFPERVGGAVAQSGSFWWPNVAAAGGESERLTRLLAAAPEVPRRVHLSVGVHEWSLVGPTRRLRDTLRDRGADPHYAEYNGGHDRACWRVGLPNALAALTHDWPRP
jgi:enterochelin esterase family protein